MFSKRDLIIFLAGATTFHALAHIMLGYWGMLPMQFGPLLLTPQLNTFVIIISAVVAVGLLWWAQGLRR